jgi:excisionase family DNA binding protein
MTEESAWLSQAEAAEYLGVTDRTIRNYIARGNLRGSRIKGSRRFESIQGAAAYAGVSSKTIRRRISDGSLTGYRMGPRLVRVDLNELDALLRPIQSAEEGEQ